MTKLVLRLILMATLSAHAAAHPRMARAQERTAGIPASTGVLLVAHGGDRGWNAGVDSLAAAVRRSAVITGPVGIGFLMGSEAARHRFQDAVDTLTRAGAHRIVVVPLLVSSRSGHYEQIRYLVRATDTLDSAMAVHLRMSGIARAPESVLLTMTAALDDAPEFAAVVATRALTLAPEPAGRALFLLGHGPNSAEDYAAWMSMLRTVADSVRRATGFTSVAVELVRDDAPAPVRAEAVKRSREIIELQYAATRRDVIVVPLLVSSGELSARTLPSDLAGLPIVYGGDPLVPHPALVRWVERMVRARTSVAAP